MAQLGYTYSLGCDWAPLGPWIIFQVHFICTYMYSHATVWCSLPHPCGDPGPIRELTVEHEMPLSDLQHCAALRLRFAPLTFYRGGSVCCEVHTQLMEDSPPSWPPPSNTSGMGLGQARGVRRHCSQTEPGFWLHNWGPPVAQQEEEKEALDLKATQGQWGRRVFGTWVVSVTLCTLSVNVSTVADVHALGVPCHLNCFFLILNFYKARFLTKLFIIECQI